MVKIRPKPVSVLAAYRSSNPDRFAPVKGSAALTVPVAAGAGRSTPAGATANAGGPALRIVASTTAHPLATAVAKLMLLEQTGEVVPLGAVPELGAVAAHPAPRAAARVIPLVHVVAVPVAQSVTVLPIEDDELELQLALPLPEAQLDPAEPEDELPELQLTVPPAAPPVLPALPPVAPVLPVPPLLPPVLSPVPPLVELDLVTHPVWAGLVWPIPLLPSHSYPLLWSTGPLGACPEGFLLSALPTQPAHGRPDALPVPLPLSEGDPFRVLE